jgi:xylose isomerase
MAAESLKQDVLSRLEASGALTAIKAQLHTVVFNALKPAAAIGGSSAQIVREFARARPAFFALELVVALLDHFKLNLETNHATLAGHTMEHEMEVAIAAGALGSIDANRGDTLLGWDTDQFPSDLYLTTNIMLRVLKMGGFTTGGLNFDAKRRRESHETSDLFHAHIGGMDAFAYGLKAAHRIIESGKLNQFVANRYSSYDAGIGAKIESRSTSLDELDTYAQGITPPTLPSGRQELLENIFNAQIFG